MRIVNRCTGRPFAMMLVGLCMVVSGSASAHIKNEASQFPDIEYSDSRFDIVLLVGAGVIPETPVFEPDKALSRQELASWVALARGLAPGGETPDTAALAAAAIDAGVLANLDGNATWGELRSSFFGDEMPVEDADAIPTKGEAASFIASHLDSETGRELLQQRGIAAGAVGTVTAIETREGHHGNTYILTIGGASIAMDAHGRVANGPTDLLQWEGRNVRRSFVRTHDDFSNWIYLEAAPDEPVLQESPPESVVEPTIAEPPAEQRQLLWWLLAGVFMLGLILFFRRRGR